MSKLTSKVLLLGFVSGALLAGCSKPLPLEPPTPKPSPVAQGAPIHRIQINDTNGNPISAARLTANCSGEVISKTADQAGRVDLGGISCPEVDATLISQGYVAKTERIRTAGESSITLTPSSPLTLNGSVSDMAGYAIADATVAINGKAKTVQTDSFGAYRFDGLSNSLIQLDVSAAGYLPSSFDVTFPQNSSTHSVAIYLTPTSMVEVLLLDSISRIPVTNIVAKYYGHTYRPNQGGILRLPVIDTGNAQIEISGPTYPSQTHQFAITNSFNAVLFLNGNSGVLSGRVVDYLGNPVQGAQVIITNPTLGATTGLDGSFLLTNVPDGFHDITFTKNVPGGVFSQDYFNVRTTVGAPTVLNVTFEPKISIHGTVIGQTPYLGYPYLSGSAVFYGAGYPTPLTSSVTSGAFSFNNIRGVAGDITITATGYHPYSIHIEPNSPVISRTIPMSPILPKISITFDNTTFYAGAVSVELCPDTNIAAHETKTVTYDLPSSIIGVNNISFSIANYAVGGKGATSTIATLNSPVSFGDLISLQVQIVDSPSAYIVTAPTITISHP